MSNEQRQQLLFESAEASVIESLYLTDATENGISCPECESVLELSYDQQNNQRYFCDNCDCFVKGSTVISVSDMDIT